MLRSQILDSIGPVLRLLRPLANNDLYIRTSDRSALIEMYGEYRRAEAQLGPDSRELLGRLGIGVEDLQETWSAALSADRDNDATISLYSRAGSAEAALRLLHHLLVRSDDTTVFGTESFTLVLPDSDGSTSPRRIIDLMAGVEGVYHACAVLSGEDSSSLHVTACDSGSDKSFEFLGVSSVVKEVRQTLVDLWDRTVFYRERRIEERVELVSKSLPLVERINTSEASGTISPEQAALLRRAAFEGVHGLVSAKALSAEMEARTSVPARLILDHDVQKQLGPGARDPNDAEDVGDSDGIDNADDGDSLDDFSSAEIAEAVKEVLRQRRARGSRRRRGPAVDDEA